MRASTSNYPKTISASKYIDVENALEEGIISNKKIAKIILVELNLLKKSVDSSPDEEDEMISFVDGATYLMKSIQFLEQQLLTDPENIKRIKIILKKAQGTKAKKKRSRKAKETAYKQLPKQVRN